MLRFLLLFLLALSAVPLTAGSSCFSLGPTEESGTTTNTSGQPTLSSGDFSSAVPCSDRDTLPNDAAFLDAVQNATEVIHSHKSYVDDARLPAVCGLGDEDNTLEATETAWNPGEGTDANVCYTLAENLSTFFVAGSGDSAGTNNAGICRSNFGFASGDTADGFPRAGTYRLDACIAGGEGGYQFRARLVVSGTDVNKTLATAAVEDVASLEVFDADGAEATTTERAKEVFIKNPYSFTFTIRSSEGTKTHLTVGVQIICVKRVSACPTPTQACD